MKNKDQKEREQIVSKPGELVFPVRKMLEDKIRIDQAIRDGIPLSSLKGINFVNPFYREQTISQ